MKDLREKRRQRGKKQNVFDDGGLRGQVSGPLILFAETERVREQVEGKKLIWMSFGI